MVFPSQEKQLSSPPGAWIDNKADTWQWFYLLPQNKYLIDRVEDGKFTLDTFTMFK